MGRGTDGTGPFAGPCEPMQYCRSWGLPQAETAAHHCAFNDKTFKSFRADRPDLPSEPVKSR